MLIKSSKKLTNLIQAYSRDRKVLDSRLHSYACSAVRLASLHGRTDWLNQLYEALSRLEKDAFRSWFTTSPGGTKTNPTDPIWGTVQWLSFKANSGFAIVPGSKRPDEEYIEYISQHEERFMFHNKSARQIAGDPMWNMALIGRFKTLQSYLHKEAEKGIPIPAHYLKVVDELALDSMRELAVIDAEPLPDEPDGDDSTNDVTHLDDSYIRPNHPMVIEGEVTASPTSERPARRRREPNSEAQASAQ